MNIQRIEELLCHRHMSLEICTDSFYVIDSMLFQYGALKQRKFEICCCYSCFTASVSCTTISQIDMCSILSLIGNFCRIKGREIGLEY